MGYALASAGLIHNQTFRAGRCFRPTRPNYVVSDAVSGAAYFYSSTDHFGLKKS